MKIRTIWNGLAIGAVGGMAMAMWSMLVLAATGVGFWAPVNAIAHTVWNGAPLEGGFDPGALVVGLVVHMAVSMMLGVVIALAATTVKTVTARTATAIGIALVAWVGQLVIWGALDRPAADLFTPWVLFVGHVMYGMVAAAGLYLADRVRQPSDAHIRQPLATQR